MTRTERTILIFGGTATAVAGVTYGLVELGVFPNPFAPPQPSTWHNFVNWPQTFNQARTRLIQLDTLWFQYYAANNNTINTTTNELHQDADSIRSVYPGAGPGLGYTCPQLITLKALPSNYNCPSTTGSAASGFVRTRRWY